MARPGIVDEQHDEPLPCQGVDQLAVGAERVVAQESGRHDHGGAASGIASSPEAALVQVCQQPPLPLGLGDRAPVERGPEALAADARQDLLGAHHGGQDLQAAPRAREPLADAALHAAVALMPCGSVRSELPVPDI